MNYKDWLEEWIGNYVQPTTKLMTFNRYFEIVHQHVIPKLGEYELEDLTPSVLQRYINELLQSGNLKNGKGLAVNSVNSIINVIQYSLQTAFNLGYLHSYSADKIKRPRVQEKA